MSPNPTTDESTTSSAASTMQSYANKGISYLQNQTFGTTDDISSNSTETTSSTTDATPASSAPSKSMSGAEKEQIENYLREGTKSGPPKNVLEGKE